MSHRCKPAARRPLASRRGLAPTKTVDPLVRLAEERSAQARREMWRYYEKEVQFFEDCRNAGPTLAEGFIRMTNDFPERFEDLLEHQVRVDELCHSANEFYISVRTGRKGDLQPAAEKDPTEPAGPGETAR